MVNKAVVINVQNYIKQIISIGIPVTSALIYGSYARGEETPESDIDVIVISPTFDIKKDNKTVNILWQNRWRVDSRIEPFPAGVREFNENETSPIIAIAHREGIVVYPRFKSKRISKRRDQHRLKINRSVSKSE